MACNRKFSAALFIVLLSYVNVPFYFAGITLFHKMFYYALALLPVFYAARKGFSAGRNMSSYLRMFLLYFIAVILVVIITGAMDFQYTAYFFRLLVGICASLSLFCIWSYEHSLGRITVGFPILYLKSVIFYIAGTVVFICAPPLRLFWRSIIVDFGETDFSDIIEYVTRFGFAGFSGFGCAFMVSSAAVIMCYLFLNKEITLKQCKVFSVCFIVGSFFYGRVGFVVSVFVCGLFSLYLLFHRRPRLFRFYIFILAVLIAAGTLCYILIPNIQPFVDWLLEPVFSFVENGKFESASTNGLKNMYKNFSPSNRTLAFGDGHWIGLDGSGYYGRTDVGFMRNILYGGIFYCFLLYSLVLLFLLFLYFRLRKNCCKGSGFIVFLMFVQFLIFELKGDITFSFLKAYIPFYLYLVCKNKMQTEKICAFNEMRKT